jgi:hypothetical protein
MLLDHHPSYPTTTQPATGVIPGRHPLIRGNTFSSRS